MRRRNALAETVREAPRCRSVPTERIYASQALVGGAITLPIATTPSLLHTLSGCTLQGSDSSGRSTNRTIALSHAPHLTKSRIGRHLPCERARDRMPTPAECRTRPRWRWRMVACVATWWLEWRSHWDVRVLSLGREITGGHVAKRRMSPSSTRGPNRLWPKMLPVLRPCRPYIRRRSRYSQLIVVSLPDFPGDEPAAIVVEDNPFG